MLARLHFAIPHIEKFKAWLGQRGYTASTIQETVRLLAGWTDWVHGEGYGVDALCEALIASRMVFTGKKSVRRYATAGALFIQYLQEQGILLQPWLPPSPAETWPVLGVFRAFMRQHRGVAEATLDNWQRDIVALLERLGDDPKSYTAIEIGRAHV